MQVRSAQSDIYFENIDIIHAGRGLVIEHRGDDSKTDNAPNPIHDIFFTDIRVEQVSGTGGTSRNPIQIKSELPGAISSIFFKRVSVGNLGPQPSLLSGYDAKNLVSNVVFENLRIGGKLIDSLTAGDLETKNAAEIQFVPSAK